MHNINGQKLKQNYPLLFFILISILFSLVNLLNSENLITPNIYDSEIHLVIGGKGEQNILNNNFQFEPSEVIVNGYQNDSCKKTCYFFDDLNNITLIFMNQISSCEKMFQNSKNILEINLSNFDASEVTAMNEMFSGCSKLSSVILSNSNTYNLINISYMFYNCINLENINFGKINSSSIESMEYLFHGCSSLNSIDLSKLDLSKVTSMFAMFYECTNLKSINFGDINTSSVKNMRSLFNRCYKLTSINLSNFDTSQVTTFQYMFKQCYKLSSINLSKFDTSKVILMEEMFYSCSNLEAIYYGKINTSSVKNMEGLFYGCSKISSIDLSEFDTSKVTSMKNLFYNCKNLEKINFGDINTSSVKTMENTFSQCSKISSIDISEFDLSKVTSMFSMFYNCTNLERINFGNINTSSVKDMRSLFNNCSKITSINLSNFDTSRVTTFQYMFIYCKNLKYLDLSNFNTLNVSNLYYMFYNCTSLIYLNLYKFQLKSTANKTNAFKGISSNLTFCVKDNFTKNFLFGNERKSICLEPCSEDKYKKIYLFIDGCVKSCINYGFEYEYKNICYHECPNGSYSLFYDEEDSIINSKECFEQKPQGYYLDINEKKYKKCYDNCKSCYGEGNETYNNCKECKDDYAFFSDLDNITKCYQICDHYYYFDESNIYHCTEKEECPENNKKLILDKKKCIDQCINDDTYKYEYKEEVIEYDSTLNINEGIYVETSEIKNNIINNENITQKIISLSSDSQVIYECKKDNTLNNNCDFLNIKNQTEILNIIQQNLDSLFDSENGKSQIIKGSDDVIYQITNAKNEKELLKNNALNNQNLTILDLGECENKLKKEYNIHDNDSLIYLKKENNNVKSSEKDVQYEIYEPYNYTKLNLSICKEEKINIYIPIILSDETKNIFENMKSLGYDMFNINDPFYQDLCTKYTTENNTDIPLSARKEYIYNNQDSQCQMNCYLSSYIPNSLYINCTCNIEQKEEKEMKTFSGKTLYKSFYDVLKYANFKILKCHKLIFNIGIFRNNMGNFIMILFFSVYFICLICFIIKGIAPFKNKIKNLFLDSNKKINDKHNIFTQNNIFQRKSNHKKNNNLKKKNIKEKFKKFKKIKVNKLIKSSNSSKHYINNLVKKNKNTKSFSEKRKIVFDEFELNELEYEEAIYYDKRSFIKIYCDKLSREHIIIFTFFVCNDYNIIYIKYARFIFLFATDMAINVFFYSDESMHKIYLNYGKYNFIQQIPQIIYTTIISQLIEILLCYLSLTDKYIYQIKKMTYNIGQKMILKILNCIKIKLVIFFIITFIFFAFYWYSIASFCAIYENTQITFIKDSLLSFSLGIIYPFIIYFIPSFLRIIALRNKKSNLKCLYKLSDIIPFF